MRINVSWVPFSLAACSQVICSQHHPCGWHQSSDEFLWAAIPLPVPDPGLSLLQCCHFISRLAGVNLNPDCRVKIFYVFRLGSQWAAASLLVHCRIELEKSIRAWDFLDIIIGTDGIYPGFVKSLFAADRLCGRAEVVSTCWGWSEICTIFQQFWILLLNHGTVFWVMVNALKFYPVMLTESRYHRWILLLEKKCFKSLLQMVFHLYR